MVNRIFRKQVPDELIFRFLKKVGVLGLADYHWFPKTLLTSTVCQELDELILELAPYYYKHKSFVLEREMNQNRYIQIIRQLLKTKDENLESKEYSTRDYYKTKQMLYRIKPKANAKVDNPDIFIVSFD
jgi:hypothetical protein